jgi:2-alkenal reductase
VASRLIAIATVWLLLLATAWVAEPYAIAFWVSATSPRAVTPRADLTEAERTTIKLYQAASPSVVHVFARASQGVSLFEPEETVVQSESGIVWDAAGHVVTNNHVINGTNEIGARFTTVADVITDVIATVNGEPVRNISDLATIFEQVGVGKTAKLTVEGDGRSRIVEVTVADVSGLMQG